MKVLRIVLATCVGMVVSSVSMAGDNDRCLSGFDSGSVKGSDQKTLCTDACKPYGGWNEKFIDNPMACECKNKVPEGTSCLTWEQYCKDGGYVVVNLPGFGEQCLKKGAVAGLSIAGGVVLGLGLTGVYQLVNKGKIGRASCRERV